MSAAQRTLFDELYTACRPGGTWPTYQHVDRLFDRHHDLDVDEIIAATPRHLLFVFDPIRPESKIGLRVAGIAKCSGSDQDLKLFLRLLRSCVAAERNFEPRSPDQPEEISLTSAQFAAIQQEHERAAGSESEETLGVTLAKAYAFLYSESLYSTLRGDETGWTITLSRDIRKYRRPKAPTTTWPSSSHRSAMNQAVRPDIRNRLRLPRIHLPHSTNDRTLPYS